MEAFVEKAATVLLENVIHQSDVNMFPKMYSVFYSKSHTNGYLETNYRLFENTSLCHWGSEA